MSLNLNLLPFCDDFLHEAALLLADRHRHDRKLCPLLPRNFEERSEARVAVEAAWRRPWASGAAAFVGERMVGYLFADAMFDQLLGRTAWVRPAGHALMESVGIGLYHDLYAVAGPRWLEMGCFDHYILELASDRSALDVWFGLSFGMQQAHALRLINGSDTTPTESLGEIAIRRATEEDRQAFAELAPLTAVYQTQAPVWAPLPAEIAAGRPEMYASVLDDVASGQATLWLAMKDELVVGFQVYYPAEQGADDLHIPEQCAELPAAATRPGFRGLGIGKRLAQHGFSHLREQGYRFCLTDWRTTNRLASRFWPRLGFQPIMYRLHRRVDERVAWARGQAGLG